MNKKANNQQLLKISITIIVLVLIIMTLFGIFGRVIVDSTADYIEEFNTSHTGNASQPGDYLSDAEVNSAKSDFGGTAVNIPLIVIAIAVIVLLLAGIGIAMKQFKGK